MKKIIVCAIVIGAVYFYTSGNSLNFDGDSAEFIVAGYCNGIPHSPGYPLFVRILNCSINIFSGMLNVPASCYLVNNILSAFNLLIAGFIIFRLCGTNENNQYNKLKTISAVFALLYLSVSRTYWTESISAEVYILHLAAISSMTGLMLFDNLISNKPLLFSVVSGAISGFSLCNHLSIVFILPFFFIYAAFKLKKLKYSFVFVLTAAIIYSGFNLDMMRRAASNPELNLGNPANFKSLKYVMLMKQYDEVMNSPIYLQAKWDFLKNNFDKEFDFIFLIISITGFIFLFRNLKREFIILLLNFLIFGACVFFFYSQVSYKGVYDTVYVFFLPLYLILTITFGYGLFGICLFFFRDGNYLKKISGILVIILVFIMIIANMVLNFNHNNMRNLDIFEKYVEDILNETGENGILLTDDDTTVYSIWYYQIVLNMFRDRLVIHPELLKTAWFLKN
nr:DUF2723 domain-containing protein [bacterium]